MTRQSTLMLIPAAIIIAAVFFYLTSAVRQLPPPEIEIQKGVMVNSGETWDVEITSDHADKHGVDAASAIRCIEHKGPMLTYRERDQRTIHLLCLNETDQKWYDVIIEMLSSGKKVLKSAFMAQDGTWAETLKWLTAKGATKWKAGPAIIRFFISP